MEVNRDIRNKYHEGFPRRKKDIQEIVIHGTAGGGSAKTLMSWMYRSGRKGYKRGVALFHYLIDYDGTVYEIIDPANWVYHSSSGRHDRKTIGIELMNPSVKNDAQYKQEQYDALSDLLLDLIHEYKIKNIVSHSYNIERYSSAYKNCPGDLFDWRWVEELLVENNYIYDFTNGCFFDIERA